MKQFLLSLFVLVINAPLYSQSVVKAENANELMTIKEVVSKAREGVEFVNNDELKARIQANPQLVLLDVRNKEEYDAGHMKGATWLERGVVEFTLARTLREPDAEIIVYCMRGNRAALVVKSLIQMGYRNVKCHLGLEDWVKDGNSIYNYLGEIKVVELKERNAASNPIDYYQDKK